MMFLSRWPAMITLYFTFLLVAHTLECEDLSGLRHGQRIADFTTASLYADTDSSITGARFVHILSDAPVYVLRIDTAPQAFVWIDTPADSNRGLAHSLEHLLASKGTKG